MKVMDGWLVCRKIMPSAERLSSKFHRPDVHFSDNLAALGIILQYSSKPDRGLLEIVPAHFIDLFAFLWLNCQPAFHFSVTSFCKTYSFFFFFHARFLALINSVI